MERCEWNPGSCLPAVRIPMGADKALHIGCPNDATLSVGDGGKWHLCASCAALPIFKSFRRRVALRASEGGSP